jgi:anhydro-N-acetylmuramic acid kinase
MAPAPVATFIGLMSGTSMDGVDGVVLDIDDASGAAPFRVRAHVHQPFASALRGELVALQVAGPNELHRAALAAHALAHAYAAVVDALLQQAAIAPSSVVAIGAHGQTVRHQPQPHDGAGYTVQLLNGALLAELSGIDVVCDLRSLDVAAGGQGAPLVPAFHQVAFGRGPSPVAVVNLGGMANVSVLAPGQPPGGFDTGPGMALLDVWCARQRGESFDREGRWAASGQVDEGLLRHWLQAPYFQQTPPKSTGRELFDAPWLDVGLRWRGGALAPVDVQATLAQLTAQSVIDALAAHAPSNTSRVVVCGGGARNLDVVARMRALWQAHTSQKGHNASVVASDDVGIPAEQVEACAFAWLAQRRVTRQTGNLPGVTGARGPRVLGALHVGHRDD